LLDWLRKIHDQPWGEAYVFFKHEDAASGPMLAGRLLALDRGVRA
jgi:hypothetical protein